MLSSHCKLYYVQLWGLANSQLACKNTEPSLILSTKSDLLKQKNLLKVVILNIKPDKITGENTELTAKQSNNLENIF